MKEGFSRLIAVLLEQAGRGEDLSSLTGRVRDVMRKELEGDDTIPGRLRALEGSLREVIPDEKLRCQAAGKALSATSKLDREEIASAINDQLEELAMLDKFLVTALPQVIAEIRAELTSLKGKAGDPHVESAAQQHVPARGITSMGSQTISKDSIFPGQAPVPEQKQNDEKDRDRAISKDSIFPASAQVAESKPAGENAGKTTEPSDGVMKQKCPLCRGQMNYSAADGKWQCPSCGFENNDDRKGRLEEKRESNALFAIGLTEPLFDRGSKNSPGYPGPGKKTSFLKKLVVPAKTCPVCARKMKPAGSGKGWQCSGCGYERNI